MIRQRLLLATALIGLTLPVAPAYATQAKKEAPAAAAEPARILVKTFNAETMTLENGLQVVVIPNHRVPVVTHMVWYKVGALDDPRGKTGIAHFVEHLMFKGSEHVPPGEFSRRVKALGGNDNAFTSQDYTAYYQSISVDNLTTVMEMESDRMRGLLFPPEHVLSERKVVLEERRQRTENDPRGYFYEQLRAALFVNHPYGNPVLGWFTELDGLERDNVMAFHNAWYAPNNAFLIISGDVTLKQIRPLIERTYALVPRKETQKRAWTAVPPLPGLIRLTFRDESVRQPSVQRLYRVPSYIQDRKDSLALDMLAEILDGGATTRLYKTLVVEQKKAISADMSYDGAAVSDGVLGLSVTPADGVTPEDAEAALDDVLRAVIKVGVTEQEITEARQRLKDAAIFARDSLSGPAMIFGQALTTGATIDDVEYWSSYLDDVTAQQIQDVAKKFLNPDNYGMQPYVTGYMLPPAPEATTPAEAATP